MENPRSDRSEIPDMKSFVDNVFWFTLQILCQKVVPEE